MLLISVGQSGLRGAAVSSQSLQFVPVDVEYCIFFVVVVYRNSCFTVCLETLCSRLTYYFFVAFGKTLAVRMDRLSFKVRVPT